MPGSNPGRGPKRNAPGTPRVFSATDLAELTDGTFSNTAPPGHPSPQEWAIAIALAESSGKVDATSPNPDGGTNYGLWQIDQKAHPSYTAGELLTAAGNLHAAADISNGGHDWSAWATYHNGSAHLRLPQARSGIAHSTSHHTTAVWQAGENVVGAIGAAGSFMEQMANVGVLGLLKIVGGILMMLLGGWMLATHVGAPGPVAVGKRAAVALAA